MLEEDSLGSHQDEIFLAAGFREPMQGQVDPEEATWGEQGGESEDEGWYSLSRTDVR